MENNNFNNNRGFNNNNPQVAAKAAVNNNNSCLTNNKLFNKCNDKKVAIGLGTVSVLALVGGGIYLYKRHQKKAKAKKEDKAAPTMEENA